MSQIHPFPHHYRMHAQCGGEAPVALSAPSLPTIASLPPEQFGGPGDHWSPETLLLGALASCFSLTFRAIARKRRLRWNDLQCAVEGVLEREGGNSRFTQCRLEVRLTVVAGSDEAELRAALLAAKQGCLISNSLNARIELDCVIEQAAAAIEVAS